ncbi:MAG: translation initiation factor IF-2 [Planctomycetaceae bacterium]|nr:translation initiation factor IF-2 [Planctomycetaceae bacterium]MCP4776498.1 translation initiation factor IF-2 [Planctomycetaceae bacterium]
MPVRIYAFAKELGLDNKQLLEICEKANIKGKGSALASLEDDEIAIVKGFMSGGEVEKTEPKPDVAAPMRPVRPVASKKKIGEIVSPVSVAPPAVEEAVEEEVEVEAQEVVEEVVETPETPEPAETPEEPARPAKRGGLLDRIRGVKPKPEEVPEKPRVSAKAKVVEPKVPKTVAPTVKPPLMPRRQPGVAPRRQLKNLDQRGNAKGEAAKKDTPKKKPAGANVRFAAMPAVKQPQPRKETGEKVQKPDIALPQDAIKSVKSGGGVAPLEHLTKSKNKKKKGKAGEAAADSEEGTKKRGLGARRERGGREDNAMGSRPSRQNRRPNRNHSSFRRRHRSGPTVNTAAPRKDNVVLQLPCSVREFSEAAGVPKVKVLFAIKQLGDESNKNINSIIEDEMVEMLVEELGIELEIREYQSLEDELLAEFDVEQEDAGSLEARAPIVTFLGHVDHGKTSLLDALIGIDVVSGEAGGITQHIRAYEIKKGENKIAFVDTPGHEAFTEMRARGANVTDIAVLVVAADDGIMPQTEEAISHAKAAGVPIIVALNKIDLPGVTPDKALQDLATHELLPSEWGGETEVIQTSAIAGTGLDELLETILVTAELHEYKANPSRPAFGTCLEAEQQSDRGVVAKIMVQGGTLKVGDVVVCGGSFGKVKAMHDTLRPKKKLKEAEPSTPVNLTGLDVAPGAGDKFYVVDDVAKAREIAATRVHRGKVEQVGSRSVETSLDEFQKLLESGNLNRNSQDMVTLNLIIRADVKGSIEAIQKELGKIVHPEVEIKILQSLAGGVSVGDVRLAHASSGVIVGFNVVANEEARSLADELGVEIRRYDVIYKITDDLKATLEGRLKPEEQVVELGMAMVLRTFSVSKTGMIAGCRVMRGSVQRECRMRVIRDQTVIGDYPIESLKRERDDAKEVQRGMECGIKLEKFNDIKEGDTLEAYKIEEVARTL